ncbi:MAG: thiamine pyrophosphate-dependent enzyme [Archaeoglobaceae archaeon]|nr:thiamine pyrophosphate-dependent enzyme [Archaeoglobaceae archaeon]MDW8118328.1 thiamine pyrophosphate-dependent enzyme [Archaeoglobaceae archaeon]
MKEHDYKTDSWIQWCPGCGNYGILTALRKALTELEIDPNKLVIVSGIGCSSRIVYYVRGSNVHTIHGRAIPVASGIKLANPELTVIVAGGDGDLLGIGAGHFVALGRRNIDLKILIHDNAVYGLTKGQPGPTLPVGVKLKAMNYANFQEAINPLLLAFASGYTFIARAFAYHTKQLKDLLFEAFAHKGSAVVDILQPCVTYNDLMTREWFEKRIYYLESIPSDAELLQKLTEREKIPLGVFYKVEKETLETRMKLMVKK